MITGRQQDRTRFGFRGASPGAALLVLIGSVEALLSSHQKLRAGFATTTAVSEDRNSTAKEAGVTFKGFYDAHASGRGIWKWSNALVAYQRHFGSFAGGTVKLAEVGVQSGGSILMWQAVLGLQCHVYGIDINNNCAKFADTATTITIGDQADVGMWSKFFAETTPTLDVLIDDGGHQSHQMLVTLQQVFPKINPGGFVSIEDIHGWQYVASFFAPAATFLSQQEAQGLVESVHVYPYLLVVKKAGVSALPASNLALSPPSAAAVDSFDALWKACALPGNLGKSVSLVNPGWGNLLAEATMSTIFAQFGGLHEYRAWDEPKGCGNTAAAVCTMTVINSNVQKMVSGVHIYPDKLVVEVAPAPPVINAVRKGTEWLPYGF